jgi:tRNA A37 threonylcarbamoyladenosine biosynthesis protein TsaE
MKKLKTNSLNKNILYSINLSGMFQKSRSLQPFQVFYELNNELPSSLINYRVDPSLLFESVIKKYNLPENDIVISKSYNSTTSKYYYHNYIIPIKKNLWVYYGPNEDNHTTACVFYCSTTNKKDFKELEQIFINSEESNDYKGKIFLIHKFEYGFDLKAYDVKLPTNNIENNYNDDVKELGEKVINELNTTNNKGLVLLYGKPGTGKTSYIRYLSTQVSKRMIFLSPEVSQYISSPEFITFLSSYTNSILIIEDAENVIKTRKAGGSSAISNLLNLTDGLLADCLNIQIICTFNTDVSQIDSALLRKGRLIAMYEFKELNKKKAKELALSLNKPVIIENDITLAELYNTEETGAQLVNFSKIGF